METTTDSQKKGRLDIEASREKRINRVKAKQRDRGGIFKPAETNPLIDILLARDITGLSPSKAQKKKPRKSSNVLRDTIDKSRRKSNVAPVAAELVANGEKSRRESHNAQGLNNTAELKKISQKCGKEEKVRELHNQAGPSKPKEASIKKDKKNVTKDKRKSRGLATSTSKRPRDASQGLDEETYLNSNMDGVLSPSKRPKKSTLEDPISNDARTKSTSKGKGKERVDLEPTFLVDIEPDSASVSLRARARSERKEKDKAKHAKEGNSKRGGGKKKGRGKGSISRTPSPGRETEQNEEDNYKTKSLKPTLETVIEEDEEMESQNKSEPEKQKTGKTQKPTSIPEKGRSSKRKRKNVAEEGQDQGDDDPAHGEAVKKFKAEKTNHIESEGNETVSKKRARKPAQKTRKVRTNQMATTTDVVPEEDTLRHPSEPETASKKTETKKNRNRAARKAVTSVNDYKVSTIDHLSNPMQTTEAPRPVLSTNDPITGTSANGRKFEYKAPKSGPKLSVKWPAPPIVEENIALRTKRTTSLSLNMALLSSPVKAVGSDDELDLLP